MAWFEIIWNYDDEEIDDCTLVSSDGLCDRGINHGSENSECDQSSGDG